MSAHNIFMSNMFSIYRITIARIDTFLGNNLDLYDLYVSLSRVFDNISCPLVDEKCPRPPNINRKIGKDKDLEVGAGCW